MKIAHLTLTSTSDSKTANDVVFGAEVNRVLLAQAIRIYRANARQGTSKTKTRSEINRTKKKWFKQKGTGNARHGARTPNIFVGGGVAHGPTGLQNWSLTLTKQMKQQALLSALAAQVEHSFITYDLDPKTTNKELRKMVEQTRTNNEKIMVVIPHLSDKAYLALRNMENVTLVTASRLSALEVAKADRLVFTESAVTALENRISGKKEATEVAAAEAPVVEKKKAATVKAAKPKVAKAITPAKAKPSKVKTATKKATKTK